MYCPKGTVHGSDCDCIPVSTDSPCGDRTDEDCWPGYLDENCECRMPCDPYWPIPEGHIWDSQACDYVPDPNYSTTFSPCTNVQCDKNFSPDESDGCKCKCAWSQDNCSEGYQFNSEICGCEFIYVDPPCLGVECSRNQVPDETNSCQCYCPLLPESCPISTDVNVVYELDSNACECVLKENSTSTTACVKQDCKRGYYWFQEACSCFLACDYIMVCPDGEKWDFIECGCVPDPDYKTTTACPRQDCKRGYLWNPFTCSCNLACDYGKECPKGQKWDFIECGCVKDPKNCEPRNCGINGYFDSKSCTCKVNNS